MKDGRRGRQKQQQAAGSRQQAAAAAATATAAAATTTTGTGTTTASRTAAIIQRRTYHLEVHQDGSKHRAHCGSSHIRSPLLPQVPQPPLHHVHRLLAVLRLLARVSELRQGPHNHQSRQVGRVDHEEVACWRPGVRGVWRGGIRSVRGWSGAVCVGGVGNGKAGCVGERGGRWGARGVGRVKDGR